MDRTTIVMCAFDEEHWQRSITCKALECIRKFTDTEEYELILVDTGPSLDQNIPYYRWDIIKPDKWLKPGDIGFSAAMNLGVKESSPDTKYVVSMHNDVFVQEGWLPKLRKFLEEGRCEVIYPDQIARTRENMKKIYAGKQPQGYDESGLQMMSKENYIKCGGWDEDFKSVYQDAAFISKKNNANLRMYCTTDTIITHLGSVTYAKYGENKNIHKSNEAKILRERYGK